MHMQSAATVIESAGVKFSTTELKHRRQKLPFLLVTNSIVHLKSQKVREYVA